MVSGMIKFERPKCWEWTAKKVKLFCDSKNQKSVKILAETLEIIFWLNYRLCVNVGPFQKSFGWCSQ